MRPIGLTVLGAALAATLVGYGSLSDKPFNLAPGN
jgi:hypothetical protein